MALSEKVFFFRSLNDLVRYLYLYVSFSFLQLKREQSLNNWNSFVEFMLRELYENSFENLSHTNAMLNGLMLKGKMLSKSIRNCIIWWAGRNSRPKLLKFQWKVYII